MHIPSEVTVTVTGEDDKAVYNVSEIIHDKLGAFNIKVNPLDPLQRVHPMADTSSYEVTLNCNPAYGGQRNGRMGPMEVHRIDAFVTTPGVADESIDVTIRGKNRQRVFWLNEVLSNALIAAGDLEVSFTKGIDNPPDFMRQAFARAEAAVHPNAFNPLVHKVVNKTPNSLVLTSIQSAFPDCDERKARWLWDKLLMWGDACSPGPAPGDQPTDGLAGAR